jgi:hypothetical protein
MPDGVSLVLTAYSIPIANAQLGFEAHWTVGVRFHEFETLASMNCAQKTRPTSRSFINPLIGDGYVRGSIKTII